MNSTTTLVETLSHTTISDAVQESLDSLVGPEPNAIHFTSSETHAFYSEIAGIAQTNAPDLSSASIATKNQVAKWTLEYWAKAIRDENIPRMLVGFLIWDFLGLSVDELEIAWDNDKRRELSERGSKLISLNISAPEQADYSTKSMIAQYNDGCANNDLAKLLSFFQSVERGIGINGDNAVPSRYIHLLSRIHEKGITNFFSRGNPLLAELVIQTLTKTDVARILAIEYQGKDAFPLCRGLVVLADRYESQWTTIDRQEIPFDHLTLILNKIRRQPQGDETFGLLMQTSSLKWNPVFHYCCGLSADTKEFIERYIDGIDFSLEENHYGNAFFEALVSQGSEENLTLASRLIFEKYCAYLKNDRGSNRLNRATSYFNFIASHVKYLSKEVEGYRSLLTGQFGQVARTIVSWYPHNATYEFRVLYLIIASNFVLLHSLDVGAPIIQDIADFVHDERHAGLLSDVSADTLIDLLTQPSNVQSLTIVYDNGQSTKLMRNAPEDGR